MNNSTFDKLNNIIKGYNSNEIAGFLQEHLPQPIVVPVILKNPVHILRMRKNESDIFSHVKEISYPPPEKTKLERANLYNCPMFYGIVSTGNDNSEGVFTSLLESIPDLLNKNENIEHIVTIGRWDIKKPLLLYALPIPTGHVESNPIANIILKKWESKKYIFPEEEIRFIEIFSSLMGENGSEKTYSITANFVNHILSTNACLQGVIYPSVQTNGLSMCVAIKTGSCDSNIQCSTATMYHYSRHKPKEALTRIIARSIVNTNNSFEWKFVENYSENTVCEIINNTRSYNL